MSYQATQIPFEVLCQCLNKIQSSNSSKKLQPLEKLKSYVTTNSQDLYELYRLLLPQLDRERANYGLKENKLAQSLIRACHMDANTSTPAKNAIHWKKPGIKFAGNFPMVMQEYLFESSCALPSPLKEQLNPILVQDINKQLDKLLISQKSEEKVAILSWFVQHLTASQMRWLIMIILKDLKLGISEKRILRNLHPDAEDYYNVTMDLKKVTQDLNNPNERQANRGLEVGNPCKPQLALRASSVQNAYQRIEHAPYIVEVKFDGERIQIHRQGNKLQYFSRKGIEWGGRLGYNVFNPVVTQSTANQNFILDGELIAWNWAKNRSEPFGTLKSLILQADSSNKKSLQRDNLKDDNEQAQYDESDGGEASKELAFMHNYVDEIVTKDMELIFVAFDLVYVDGVSVANETLLERQIHLRHIFKDLVNMIQDNSCKVRGREGGILIGDQGCHGRILPLLPDMEIFQNFVWSKQGQDFVQLELMFQNYAIQGQEEGVVVKKQDSKWMVNDRSNSWLKVKPDYIYFNEIDCLVIGAYAGQGRRGNQVAEYLLGIINDNTFINDTSKENLQFLSFTRVGTGLTDEERCNVSSILEPLLIDSKTNPAPTFYKMTGQGKETPDYYIKDPRQSLVFQVQADFRLITSSVYSTYHTLRFPRIQRIRWDKNYKNIMAYSELIQLAQEMKGYLRKAKEKISKTPQGQANDRNINRSNKSAHKRRQIDVLANFQAIDITNIQQEALILKHSLTYFINYGELGKQKTELMVAKLGGVVSQNYTNKVNLVLASEIITKISQRRFQKGVYNVLSLQWLLDCYESKKLVQLRPSYYLYYCVRLQNAQLDKFGDNYFQPSTQKDIQALLNVLMEEAKIEHIFIDCDKVNINRPLQYLTNNHKSSQQDVLSDQETIDCLNDALQQFPRNTIQQLQYQYDLQSANFDNFNISNFSFLSNAIAYFPNQPTTIQISSNDVLAYVQLQDYYNIYQKRVETFIQNKLQNNSQEISQQDKNNSKQLHHNNIFEGKNIKALDNISPQHISSLDILLNQIIILMELNGMQVTKELSDDTNIIIFQAEDLQQLRRQVLESKKFEKSMLYENKLHNGTTIIDIRSIISLINLQSTVNQNIDLKLGVLKSSSSIQVVQQAIQQIKHIYEDSCKKQLYVKLTLEKEQLTQEQVTQFPRNKRKTEDIENNKLPTPQKRGYISPKKRKVVNLNFRC